MKRTLPSIRPLRRILVINPVGGLGGAERALIDFISSARETRPGLAFHVLLFADGPLAAEVERLGATVSVLPLPFRLHSLGDSGLSTDRRLPRELRLIWALLRAAPALAAFVLALRSEILRRLPDIIHSNGMKAHMLSGLAAPSGVPLIWHMHDFLSERPFAKHFLKLISGRADAIIAISNAVAEVTRRVLPSVRIATILNAVDVTEFSPGPPNGPELDLLSGMNTPTDRALRIGLVATYARWKGQDVFLRAAARIHHSLPAKSLRFYVIGGPIYATGASQFSTEELTALIAELGLQGTAGLIPFRKDLVPLLRSLDVFVHASSRPEPFGRSVVEAMACSLPVIVAAGGGIGEIVDAGETGLTHAPGDAEGLADALRVLIESAPLRQRLAGQARRAAVVRFSRNRLGPALIALYLSLL